MQTSLQIIIEAIDKASAVIDTVRKKTEAMDTVAKGFGAQNSAAALSTTFALEKLGVGLDDVAHKNIESVPTFQRVGDAIGQEKFVVAGLVAAIASIPAALAALGGRAIDTADNVNEMSQSIGTSADFLSAMILPAKQSGLELSDLQIGFRQLARNIVEAKNPASEAALNFRTMGIEMSQLTEDQKGVEAIFNRLADGFNDMADGFGKTTAATELLGRAGEKFIPLFKGGSEAIAEATKQARLFGAVVGNDLAKSADEFNDKMSSVKAIFTGIGNEIARAALPYLHQFVDFAIAHAAEIRTGFYAMAAAVTALSTALLTLKAVKILDNVLAALVGPAALAQIVGMASGVAILKESLINLALQFKLMQLGADGAFGATMLGKIGLYTGAVASIAAAIYAAALGFKALSAAQEEALSKQNLGTQNITRREQVERTVSKLQESGTITDDQAQTFRDRIEAAFKGKPVEIPITVSGGTGGATQIGKRIELIGRDEIQEAKTLTDITRELRAQAELRESISQKTRQTVFASQTEQAIAQSRFDIFKAQKDLELVQVKQEFNRPGSTVTVDERVSRERIIQEQIKTEQIKTIEAVATLRKAEARRLIEEDDRVKSQKDPARREAIIQTTIADEVKRIDTQLAVDRTRIETEFETTKIGLVNDAASGNLEAEKRAATSRLTLATITSNELLVQELQFQQARQDLLDANKNLPENLRLSADEINHAAQIKFERERFLTRQRDAEALLSLDRARVDAQRQLIASDPTPNISAKQVRLNELLREQNQLILEEIRLNKEAVASGKLNETESIERKKKIIELESTVIQNNRARNLQDPTDLPQFQSSLGFQNRLDEQGNLTGGRDLVAPFRALDDFLTGTLQTTFGSLSRSISGLFTGASTWAQTWTQAGNQVLEMFVQLILEYTLFNQIRTALDAIFHRGAQASILTTSAVGKSAQASQAATAATTGAATATAYAPAAAATSIASFGSAATIGLVLALAAIAGIVAAFAFKSGGTVPQSDGKRRPVGGAPVQASGSSQARAGLFAGAGGPREDKILTSAVPETGIVNAAAVQYYGGDSFVRFLAGANLTDVVRTTTSNFGPSGGERVPIRVSPGEAWVDPERVRELGGSSVIDQINALQFPAERIRNAAAGLAAFSAGGLVDERRVGGKAPAFSSGGTVALDVFRGFMAPVIHPGVTSVNLGQIAIPFQDGGTVTSDASLSRGSQVGHLLQATVESRPAIEIPPAQVIIYNRRDDMLEDLRTRKGRAIIAELWSGMKTEFGVPS